MVAEYAGFSDGKDGPTHTSMEDLGMMRAIPEIVILSPSDPVMTGKMVEAAAAYDGPVYIRVETEALPPLYGEDVPFEIGRSYLLRRGEDVTLIAYGSAVSRAVRAAGELEREGIRAAVIDAATLKPFDAGPLLESVGRTGRVVSVEDHNIHGGLASIVSEALAQNGVAAAFLPLAVREQFTESGPPERLRKKYGTSCEHIVAAARALCEGGGHDGQTG